MLNTLNYVPFMRILAFSSHQGQFQWRNPEINPYIARDEMRNTVTSRYWDVAMAKGHA